MRNEVGLSINSQPMRDFEKLCVWSLVAWWCFIAPTKDGSENAKNSVESGLFLSQQNSNIQIGVQDPKLVYWSGIK